MGIKELGYAKFPEGPGGCSPQNTPVCTIHLTSQLMWLLSLLEHDRCPNSPYDNLWFTFCSKIYQNIRYSGKSSSNFAPQGGKKGARSSHAAWIRPLKRPRSQIDVHTYKVILFLRMAFGGTASEQNCKILVALWKHTISICQLKWAKLDLEAVHLIHCQTSLPGTVLRTDFY